ncbi:hypothetical protein I3843_Q023800 [Carya illinoinensis]|nr:hypothetical protein I3843_Q023800 [Carya illinoinensis]
MKPDVSSSVLIPFVITLLFSFLWATSAHTHEDFIQCLTLHTGNSTSSISQVIYTPANSSYLYVLEFSIQNPRFSTPATPKPLVIITPLHISQIQASIKCSQKHGMQIRVRSGENGTAWVEASAIIGEVYYRIAEKSRNFGFPAGLCPTVGVGGHFSGGGYGTLLRKYGLAADNIVDAQMIDVKGRILDRESMGEDLFWAIRGGGGASFGVIVRWKIKLVPVPSIVTVFTVNRNLEQNATKLVHRWQYVADKLDVDLFIRVILSAANSSQEGRRTIQASFNSLTPLPRPTFFKAKSDYVMEPIPEVGLEGIWERFYQKEAKEAELILSPYGGRMSEIPESAIPFPHRVGNIYKIQHLVNWEEEGIKAYSYMAAYVSKSPRAAYINYRDLDIGTNSKEGNASYKTGKYMGTKYFKSNFNRLVHVKTMVDPTNFFKNEQASQLFHPSER